MIIIDHSPRSHLIYLKRLTSTKIDNNELQWHQGSKRSTEIQKTPNVTKSFPYISKGNYNSVLKICTYYYAHCQRQKDEIRHKECPSTYSIYKNMGLAELQCIKNYSNDTVNMYYLIILIIPGLIYSAIQSVR